MRLPSSDSQFVVRPDAHESERRRVRLLVDEHEIRPDMAVAELLPGAAQRVVVVVRVEGNVVGEGVHDDGKALIEVLPVAASGLAPVVPFEPGRPPNRPHAGRRAAR